MSKKVVIGQVEAVIGLCYVTCSPSTKMRRWLPDIIPYWQGSQPKFKVTFTATSDLTGEYKYLCSTEFSNGEESEKHELCFKDIKQGKSKSYTIGEMPLYYTGDAFITVAEITGGQHLSGDKTKVYMFHVTNRSWLFLTLIAGILAGVISFAGSVITC